MNSDFKDLLQALNDAEVKYLVVGGYAVAKHTEPRYTKDLDVWINRSKENAELLLTALRVYGAPIADISVDDLIQDDTFFQIGVEPVRIDIIMDLKAMKFNDCWLRRVVADVEGVSINFISISDLIENKEKTARPQDLIDAKHLRTKVRLLD